MILPLSADHFTLHVEGSPQLFYNINIKKALTWKMVSHQQLPYFSLFHSCSCIWKKNQLLPQPHLSAICSTLTKVSLLCKRLHGCGLENINNFP